MSTTPLVIVGCGGHGRELYAAVSAVNSIRPTWDVLGFVDDDPAHLDRLERLGATVLGPLDWLEEHPCTYALGLGTSRVRRAVSQRLEASGCTPAGVVHPGARIGPDVELAEGVVVYERTTVTTNVRIGRHSHLNVACAVQHDSVVGEFVQMSPGVLVNGDCRIADDAFLGSGAIITRGCAVGRRSRVGAGAVVLADVPDDVTVVGAPAATPPAGAEPAR